MFKLTPVTSKIGQGHPSSNLTKTLLRYIHGISFGSIRLIFVELSCLQAKCWRTDRQTDGQTDRRTHQSNSRVGYTQPTQKWIPRITFSGKSDLTRDFMNSIKWFNFVLTMAAILAAILDFSRISSWYPPDIRSRDTKYIKSSEKKTFTVNAGYRCLAAWLWC